MSYKFDGTNDNLNGSFTSTYAIPCTLACFIKVPNHYVAADCILQLGLNSGSEGDSLSLRTTATDDNWTAQVRDTAGTNDGATLVLNVDAVWVGFVGTFTSTTRRDIYMQSIANTASSTSSKAVASGLQFIKAGENMAGGSDWGAANPNEARIAEIAIWNSVLSGADITSYLGGTAASSISAANLVGYWPLSSASLTNLGLDASGTLTAAGNAAFDSDHPVITTLAPIRLVWRM